MKENEVAPPPSLKRRIEALKLKSQALKQKQTKN